MRGERIEGFVILNHVGTVWTPAVFPEHRLAQEYLDRMRTEQPTWNLSKHRIVPATATVYPKVS